MDLKPNMLRQDSIVTIRRQFKHIHFPSNYRVSLRTTNDTNEEEAKTAMESDEVGEHCTRNPSTARHQCSKFCGVPGADSGVLAR